MLAEPSGRSRRSFDIAPALEAIGCYRSRDDAVRAVFPEYGEGWRIKIVIAGGIEGRINFRKLVAESPAGEPGRAHSASANICRSSPRTNFKQRIRKTLEYFHADRLNYAVVGTPNRLEYDQGFFVKNGDGAADVKPIAHLYKTQVYGMARHLGLPADVVCAATRRPTPTASSRARTSSTSRCPTGRWTWRCGRSTTAAAAELAGALEISETQAEPVYDDIRTKRRTTRYMHARADAGRAGRGARQVTARRPGD